MSKVKCCFIYFFLVIVSITANETSNYKLHFTPTTLSTPEYIPYRYIRFVFFFLSENVTTTFFKKIINQLIDFDNYCGGENVENYFFFGPHYPTSCEFCSFEEHLYGYLQINSNPGNFWEQIIAKNVTAGSIDNNDVRNLSATLISELSDIKKSLSAIKFGATSVILITDYATASLSNSSNTTKALRNFKNEANVMFIALITNITDDTLVRTYFPEDIWTTNPGYMNWTEQNLIPICSWQNTNYTTPSPPFRGDATLNIFLFLTFAYVDRTNLTGIVSLLSEIALRRWSNPCRQYRSIKFSFFMPSNGSLHATSSPSNSSCYAEYKNSFSNFSSICDPDFINIIVNGNNWQNNFQDDECNNIYDKFFNMFVHDLALEVNKYLLITDVEYPCSDFTVEAKGRLANYSTYSTGAPLTIIAIDKMTEHKVGDSYDQLFPATQKPNLYKVNDIAQLLFNNMSNTINFCLHTAPLLETPEKEQVTISNVQIWYFYLIGVAILIAITLFLGYFLWKRRSKRLGRLRQIRERFDVVRRSVTRVETSTNQYEETSLSHLAFKDNWEISLQSLSIDYRAVLGKGAFSVVYSGKICVPESVPKSERRIIRTRLCKADLLPLLAVRSKQQFIDCNVAVKVLPQHNSETDKISFRNEIRIMKEIGFHNHLVCMLGCNVSIDRPILVMELAEQDLLHWLLIATSTSMSETENVEKTLLSISWQVSDGMSYLAAKNVVHRDLAARNVLLNAEMKAMVSDFGLCRTLNNSEQVLTIPGGRLPIKWMALESLQEHQFSLKTDVWSFGILLFEIFSFGQQPYADLSGEEVAAFIQNGSRLNKPAFASEQIYDLMKQCWQVNPDQRPEFITLQSHFARFLEESVATYGYLLTTERQTSCDS